MENKNTPQISVIVPMYNVEKYVGECLDSLLCQTFQDFEVIVADDCSTDGSRKVVEEYQPKFNGRLRIVSTEKNSGGCTMPRNVGMEYASGKYLFFLDSDDLIVKTGLEQLYNVAEEFKADVVQCETFYTSTTSHLKGAELTVKGFKKEGYVTEPTLDTYNIRRRINELHANKYAWTVWTKLLRRDFMLENEVYFPLTLNNEDLIFTIYCLSCAKRLVKYPAPINIYRYRESSIVHAKTNIIDHIRKCVRSLATGFSCCDRFLSTLEFYKENPDVKYLAFDSIAQNIFGKLFSAYKKFSPALIDDIIRDEFRKFGDNPEMAAFFFNMSLMYSLQMGTYLLNNSSNVKVE